MVWDDDLEAAHKHSAPNRDEIARSEVCGCLYCRSVFARTAITDWCDEVDGENMTALCPRCGIDSVLPSASGYPVADKQFLERMHAYWFERTVTLPGSRPHTAQAPR